MIPMAEIKRLAAKNHVSLGTVERDYVICWFLYGVSHTTKNQIFKGGTALRKIYFPGWRFSEDLDFSSKVTMDKTEVESLLKSINERASESGIVFDIKSIHVNPEYCMGKVHYTGPLQTKNSLKIDISMNEFLHEKYPFQKVLWDLRLNKIIMVDVKEEDVEKIKNEVLEIINDILEEKFDPLPGWECGNCDYDILCDEGR